MFPNFLVASVLKNNVYADALGFVFNTSVEQFFKSLRDNVGGFIFAEEMNKQRTLAGYPYRTTNLIDTVEGKTKIAFGNWNDLIIGEQGALEIETSREGSWTDEAGNLVSAFEQDQTLIRAIDNVDVGLRHDESFVVATGVAVPV
jgi:HK97 family phage major capsid protein